jgi:hypothetical protein
MTLRRLSEKEDLEKIRRGYIINVHSKRAYLHTPNCITISMINPRRKEKGGVYYSESLEEAIQWVKDEGLRHSPCRLCLPTLTYTPKASRLNP